MKRMIVLVISTLLITTCLPTIAYAESIDSGISTTAVSATTEGKESKENSSDSDATAGEKDGKEENSDAASATEEGDKDSKDEAKFEAPKLIGKCTGTQSITLEFYGEGAKGYYIYRYNSETKKYEKIKTINTKKNAHSFTFKDTTLKKNTTYKYKVTSFKYDKEGKKIISPRSNIVKVKTRSNIHRQSSKINKEYFKDYEGNLRMEMSKLYYDNGKLVFKGNVVNCTGDYITKFNYVTISLYKDGKLIAEQKFRDRDLEIDAKEYKTKYFKFADKGMKVKNVNLRYGEYELKWEGNYEYIM